MYAYACTNVYLYTCIIAYTYTQTQTHTGVEYLLGDFLQGTKLGNKTSQKVTLSHSTTTQRKSKSFTMHVGMYWKVSFNGCLVPVKMKYLQIFFYWKS